MEFYHIALMLRVFFAKKDKMPDNIGDLNTDMMARDDIVGPEYYVKVKHFVMEYEKRKWL